MSGFVSADDTSEDILDITTIVIAAKTNTIPNINNQFFLPVTEFWLFLDCSRLLCCRMVKLLLSFQSSIEYSMDKHYQLSFFDR